MWVKLIFIRKHDLLTWYSLTLLIFFILFLFKLPEPAGSLVEPAGPRETTGTTRSGDPKELGEREEAADGPAGLAGPEESAEPGEPAGSREGVAPAGSDNPAGPEGPAVPGELAGDREEVALARFNEPAGPAGPEEPAGPGEPAGNRGEEGPRGPGIGEPAGPGEVPRGEPGDRGEAEPPRLRRHA